MTTETIIQLIIAYSMQFGIDPQTALAVAKVESNFKPAAIGSVGEVGLFQVRPQYSKYSKEQLKNPHLNIREGLRMLKFAKQNCLHKQNKTWLVCYNMGVNAAKRVKHPHLFPYYKKVLAAKKEVQKHADFYISVDYLDQNYYAIYLK